MLNFISPTVSRCQCVFLWIRFAMKLLFFVFYRLLWYEISERFARGRKDYFVHTYKFSLVHKQFHNQNRSRITAKSTKKYRDTEKSMYARNENGSMWNEWRYANGTLSPRLHELNHEKKTQLRFLYLENAQLFFSPILFGTKMLMVRIWTTALQKQVLDLISKCDLIFTIF